MDNSERKAIVFPGIRELGGNYRTMDGSKSLAHETKFYAKTIRMDRSLSEQLSKDEVEYIIREHIAARVNKATLSALVAQLAQTVNKL